jgi:hypothetical protein
MGSQSWEVQPGMSTGEQKVIEEGNRALFG